MKIHRFVSLSILLPLLLGCASHVRYPNETYIKTLTTTDISSFTICVFNDLHISTLTNLNQEFEYYEKCLASNGGAKPDMLVLNGDTFMDANKAAVKAFFSWLDKLNIPFAFTYGNHDLQGEYSSYYLDKTIKGCTNSLLSNPLDDDVYGDSNYVVNIKEGDTLKWQLYFFDSNTYHGLDYDVVHQDQINWYKRQVEAATNIPSLSFMHIPTEEFATVYDTIGHHQKSGQDATTGSLWYMGESISDGDSDTELYETMQQYGNTQAIIVAHDHINVTDWHYDKDGGSTDNMIRLIYGVKTGRGIYHDNRIMGCSFYTLNNTDPTNPTFDIKWMNVQYGDDIPFIMDADYVTHLWGGYQG